LGSLKITEAGSFWSLKCKKSPNQDFIFPFDRKGSKVHKVVVVYKNSTDIAYNGNRIDYE